MSILADEIRKYVQSTFKDVWSTPTSEKVPTDDDSLSLGNQGVLIDAVVLYADLKDSTGLVTNYPDKFAAEVYKAFVYSAAKAIRYHSGVVTAYDGDRVMGIFMGGSKRNNAVETAFHINAIRKDILDPELQAVYSSTGYRFGHKVGIDAGQLLVANTGIRGNNDYVWVGAAANNAAKMAALKRGYTSYITHEIYSYLSDSNKLSSEGGGNLWASLGASDLGYTIYGSGGYKVNV